MKRVVLGISGGVDSAAAAIRLKQDGYEVIGAFLSMHDLSAEASLDAKSLADKLGIRFVLEDLSTEFEENVIKPFINVYSEGGTPNPCIVCNPTVKFSALCRIADRMGAEKIATGHYAGIGRDASTGRLFIKKSPDKDQSYMLCRLTQTQLERTLFPLYGTLKADNRRLVSDFGIDLASKPDSQENCFIPKNVSYVDFIRDRGLSFPRGDFILDQKKVGTHNGIICYTVGQRKNLGIALGFPVYVKEIDIVNNHVILSKEDVSDCKGAVCSDIVFQALPETTASFEARAKIRFSSGDTACSCRIEGGRIIAVFSEPARAVTRGQAAVFYRGDTVLASGLIEGSL